jgi:phosphoglycolate phosphatase-like HAD superfamily hydrolase
MVGDAPSDWEAGLAAGVSVAAIVADAAGERRLCPGVSAYATLLDWATAVFG